MTQDLSEIFARNQQAFRIRSGALTGLILGLLVLLAVGLTGLIRKNPPDPPEEYQMVGTIDFGDFNEGSQEVNTMAEASANPSPMRNAPTQRPTQSNATSANTLTGSEQTGVRGTTGSGQTTTGPTDAVDNPMTFDGGGSNEGNSNGVGNQGVPGAPLTDGDGLSWGESGGRRLLNRFMPPAYDVDEEGTMEFVIVIRPDGNVRAVETGSRMCACPIMNQRMKAKLKLLKFNQIQGNQEQRITVKYFLRQT